MELIIDQPVTKLQLGTPSIIENTFFSVERSDFADFFGVKNHNAKYQQVIHSEDLDNKVLGIVGANYTVVKNKDLVLPIMGHLTDIFGKNGFSCGVKNQDDVAFYFKFVVNSETYQLPSGDKLNMMVTVANSYDGSLKNFIKVEYFRQVCTNGLHAWQTDGHIFKKHQSGNMCTMHELEKSFAKARETVNKYKSLEERQLTPDELERVWIAFETTDLPKKKLPLMKDILSNEMNILGESKPNAWLVYNAANNIVNHHYGNDKLSEDYRVKLDFQIGKIIDNLIMN